MSWPIRFIEMPTNPAQDGYNLKIGDCFYYQDPGPEYDWAADALNLRWFRFFCKEDRLSENYKQQHRATRPPILVYLPGCSLFCVDGACWSSVPKPDGQGSVVEYYGGWTVSGTPQLLTVSPSINCVGIYHGFIQNGVITDDCEGRKYDETGRQM